MPKKITDFESKNSLAALDLIPIIDVGDDTMHPSGSNKKITAQVFANGLAKIITSNAIISANTTVSALHITQTGTGNALLVEDSSNPDSSPFTIDSSGGVAIGTLSPSTSCILHLESTTRGFRPPSMTTSQRNVISNPIAGVIIYNNTTKKLNFYNGTAWEVISSSV